MECARQIDARVRETFSLRRIHPGPTETGSNLRFEDAYRLHPVTLYSTRYTDYLRHAARALLVRKVNDEIDRTGNRRYNKAVSDVLTSK